MDARFLVAAAAAATTVGALGLVAVVLTGQADQLPTRSNAPVLIARTEPPPPAFDTPPAVLPHVPAVEPSVAVAPTPAPVLAPAPEPPPPRVTRPVVAALPPASEAAPPPPPMRIAPAPPAPKPKIVDHRYDGVLTVSEIGRIRTALKLSPDQEPYWPPIASILREVGRHQMAQVDAGQKPTFDLDGDLSSRLYSAVGPLLGTLRDDQKEEVRRRAKMLGLDSVASFI